MKTVIAMSTVGCAVAALIIVCSVIVGQANGKSARSAGTDRLDRMEFPPNDYVGPTFQPSYKFPKNLPLGEPRPWEAIDFKAEPERYTYALLNYVLEGQDKDRWTLEANPVRRWYHVPWMGPGGTGREFVNGLTAERRSLPFELGTSQKKCRQNWAVGFYNPVGGYALGRMWARVASGVNPKPDLSALPFPMGTVVAKALYTEATAEDTPILAGAPTIKTRIIKDESPDDDKCPSQTTDGKPDGPPSKREAATLRLLQFDIAVRDPNADEFTGWVFMTFIYDGRLPGSDPWAKLRPVGLMWGNDYGLSDDLASQGVKPAEGIVLSQFGLERNFGRGGRMNGPVDNPKSACLSCHMTAQTPTESVMRPPDGASWDVAKCWFRNLKPTEPFGLLPESPSDCSTNSPKRTSLDYSLQLAVAVRNVEIEKLRGKSIGLLSSERQHKTVDFDSTIEIQGVKSPPITRDGD